MNNEPISPAAFPQLRHPYDTWCHAGKWDEYIAGLCDDGLKWWFTMDTPSLAAHLATLTDLSWSTRLPTRVVFLQEILSPATSVETLDNLYTVFIRKDDYEGASAAASAAIQHIIDSGMKFERLTTWYSRIDELCSMSRTGVVPETFSKYSKRQEVIKNGLLG